MSFRDLSYRLVGSLLLVLMAFLVVSWMAPGLWLERAGLRGEFWVCIGFIVTPIAGLVWALCARGARFIKATIGGGFALAAVGAAPLALGMLFGSFDESLLGASCFHMVVGLPGIGIEAIGMLGMILRGQGERRSNTLDGSKG